MSHHIDPLRPVRALLIGLVLALFLWPALMALGYFFGLFLGEVFLTWF